MTITNVQAKSASSSPSTTSVAVTLDTAATAGNILWCAAGLDKSAGTITPPSGFTAILNHAGTSVSTYLGYKVAAGGETTITVARSTTSGAGDSAWVGEFADDSGTAAWSIWSSATNPTDESSVTSWPSGTAADPGRTCAALAAFSIDSESNSTGSETWTSSFTELKGWGAGDGVGGIAVGWLSSTAGGSTKATTHGHTGTADQVSGAIVTFSRALTVTRTPADAATPTDSPVVAGARARVAADTVSVSDTVIRVRLAAASDSVSVSDAVARRAGLLRGVPDVASPSDGPSAGGDWVRGVADTVVVDDVAFVRGGVPRRVVTYFGAVTVGRLVLTESPEVTQKSDSARTVSLSGQEASPPLASQDEAWARAKELLAYRGATVPVAFQDKPHLDGWYTVGAVTAVEVTWGSVTTIRWQCELTWAGGDAEVEVESRLVGGNRTHASSAVAELWHAPPPWTDSYLVGSSTPGAVTRLSEDGPITVYRSIPAGTNPRWGVAAVDYLSAAAEVTVDGAVRTGLVCADTPGNWALSNGLLRVEPRTSAGTLRVTSHLFSTWGTAKVFDVKRGATSLGAARHVTILRNDPCEVVIRLTWDNAPGRTTCDLSLKRGSRFVGIYVQQHAATAALRVDDNAGGGTVTDQLTAAGYIATTSDDPDSNRWVIGSTLACTAAGTFGAAASVAALGLPAYIGCVYRGGSAASGDAVADVNAQFLGAPAETERVIRR